MTRLLLIDKDQTLIRSRLGGENYVQKPWDQVPIPGIAEKLTEYSELDYKIVVISNQGGIEKGFKSLESTMLEMEYCLELFPQIHECFFCPDFKGYECYRVWREDFINYDSSNYDVQMLDLDMLFRKPKPGMLKLAMHIHISDEYLFVGDRDCDFGAAQAANIPFMWRDEFLGIK